MGLRKHSAAFVLFDLDGTLVDPAPGIIGSVQYAMKSLGHAVPRHQDLLWVIGPPLRMSFTRLLDNQVEVERAVAFYREAYNDGGLTQAEPYEGIYDALASLKDAGYKLFVCTSKPLPFARKVVDHFGFSEYFDELFGPDLDGRFDDKGELISHILASQNLAAAAGCMIGDRANDTLAAHQNGMSSIGVTWGYGGPNELQENSATILCEIISDIPERVRFLLSR